MRTKMTKRKVAIPKQLPAKPGDAKRDPEFVRQMSLARDIMKRRQSVLRELAK